MAEALRYRVGVDIGGTFTDIVLMPERGEVSTYKTLTTPDDFGRGIAEGIRKALEAVGAPPASVERVIHATTVATNAILEHKGAKTGLVTTRGFRDVDVVLDLIGGEVHARSYPVMKKGGRLVWLIAKPFEDRSAQFGVKLVQAMIHDDPVSLAGVIDLAGRGVLVPQVSRLMPLAEAAAAQSIVQDNANSRGRVILDVRGRASEIPVQRSGK